PLRALPRNSEKHGRQTAAARVIHRSEGPYSLRHPGSTFSAPIPAPYLGGMIMELSGRGAMVRALAADLATAGEAALGPLPEWDLGDLYPGRDTPQLSRDLPALAPEATPFRPRPRPPPPSLAKTTNASPPRHESHLANLSGGALGAAIAEYEKLQEIAGRIISYAELTRAGN